MVYWYWFLGVGLIDIQRKTFQKQCFQALKRHFQYQFNPQNGHSNRQNKAFLTQLPYTINELPWSDPIYLIPFSYPLNSQIYPFLTAINRIQHWIRDNSEIDLIATGTIITINKNL